MNLLHRKPHRAPARGCPCSGWALSKACARTYACTCGSPVEFEVRPGRPGVVYVVAHDFPPPKAERTAS